MDGCIKHTDYKSPKGYDRKSVKVNGQWLVVGSHRVAYCEANNITLDSIRGLHVRHTCDNPECINPKHLLIGTHQDNVDDKVSRSRQVKGIDVHTNVLSEEDVRYIRRVYKSRHPEFSALALSRKYNVSSSTVDRIIHRKIWKSLE